MVKFFSFVHAYLSPLQGAIQTAHVVANMFLLEDATYKRVAENWAKNSSTLVILNGGDSGRLQSIYELTREQNTYATAAFFESSMDNMLTAVGMILPEKIWKTADMLRQGELDAIAFSMNRTVTLLASEKFTENEYQLTMLLAESRLFV